MRHKPQNELSSVSLWLPFFTAILPRQTCSGSLPHTPYVLKNSFCSLLILSKYHVHNYAYTGKDKF